MNPLMDTQKISDEEIIARLGRAYTYLNMQVMLGHNATVESIKQVIDSLEEERAARFRNTISAEAAKKNPKADAPITLGKLE